MNKYLAVVREDRGDGFGLFFRNYQSGHFENFSAKAEELEEIISNYSPDAIVSREKFCPSLSSLSLNIIRAAKHKKLEKLIWEEKTSIDGLEKRSMKTYPFFPAYYFQGKKLTRSEKKALYCLWLYEPWQSEERSFELKPNAVKENAFNFQSLKNINMSDLDPKVQKLGEELISASKISFVGSLKSSEISFLMRKVQKFSKILESLYQLKFDEELEEESNEEEEKNELNNDN